MGETAARYVFDHLTDCIGVQGSARVIFACAPSQNAFLSSLVALSCSGRLDWTRVEIFHMDEYVGLQEDDPRSFRYYLKTHLLTHITPRAFYPLEGDAPDLEQISSAYSAKLAEAPIDLICMGIGENGHVAFNDPPVADFSDARGVKIIPLDPVCRQQQVNDGCFPSLKDVPQSALTITIPVFRCARALSCVVPNMRKAEAVRKTVKDPVGESCPSTLLREHPRARLFLDRGAASRLIEENS